MIDFLMIAIPVYIAGFIVFIPLLKPRNNLTVWLSIIVWPLTLVMIGALYLLATMWRVDDNR